MPRREPSVAIETDAVQDVRGDLERAAVRAVEELRPEGCKAGRIVELVTVHAEDPRVRARVRFDKAMRLARVMHTMRVEMVVVSLQRAQNLPRQGRIRGTRRSCTPARAVRASARRS